MRGAIRGRGALLFASALCGSTGCLPAGGPPTGQRWLAGRTLELVEFAPDLNGVPASILVTDGIAGTSTDLYAVADPGPNAASSAAPTLASGAKLLVSNISPTAGFRYEMQPSLSQDADGRLLVPQAVPDTAFTEGSDLFRVDLTTDTAVDLGPQSQFVLSPSGARLLLVDPTGGVDPTGNSATLYEADGRQTALSNIYGPAFVGEDLYFSFGAVDPGDFSSLALQRLPPGGTPETVAESVQDFQTVAIPGATLMIVTGVGADGNYVSSLLDLTTLAQTSLQGSYGSVSPDGRWLQVVGASGDDLVFDRSTGTVQPMGTIYANGFWRPGHDEYWVPPQSSYPPSSNIGPSVQIWRPEDGLKTIDLTTETPSGAPLVPMTNYYLANDGSYTPFTADGAHWFSLENDSSRGRNLVGPADDPTAPSFPVNPAGTYPGQYWQLGDGRLLVEAQVDDPSRNDIYLVDPNSGQTRELASGGHIVTVGSTRALALLDWVSAGSGDLMLIDYDGGATTLLGQNVAEAILKQPLDPSDPALDPLAPGAEVAFVVQGQIDSPYDGIWVARLP
jgi:hypothetical protein